MEQPSGAIWGSVSFPRTHRHATYLSVFFLLTVELLKNSKTVNCSHYWVSVRCFNRDSGVVEQCLKLPAFYMSDILGLCQVFFVTFWSRQSGKHSYWPGGQKCHSYIIVFQMFASPPSTLSRKAGASSFTHFGDHSKTSQCSCEKRSLSLV